MQITSEVTTVVLTIFLLNISSSYGFDYYKILAIQYKDDPIYLSCLSKVAEKIRIEEAKVETTTQMTTTTTRMSVEQVLKNRGLKEGTVMFDIMRRNMEGTRTAVQDSMSIFTEGAVLEKTETLYKKAIDSKLCMTTEQYERMSLNAIMKFILDDAGRDSAKGVDYCTLYKVREKLNVLQLRNFQMLAADKKPDDIDENEIRRELTSFVSGLKQDCKSSLCRYNWMKNMLNSISDTCWDFMRPENVDY